jgi:hypothetical protein
MDYKDFKKVAEDAKSATLKHPKGHVIRIAKATLSPQHLKELCALPLHKAEGGAVNSNNQAAVLKENYGKKKARYMADGGLPVPKPEPAPTPTPDPNELDSSDSKPQSPVTINIGQPQAQPAPTLASSAAPLPSPQTPPQPPKPSSAAVVPDPNAGNDADQAQPAAAPQSTAPQSASAAPNQANAPISDKDMYAQILNSKDTQYYQDLVNGNIKPETYQSLYAKKDTLGKIGTLFGMLVAGAGAGLVHQPNAVMNMMDQQITNDFEAQKANKSNALSMLQRYQQHQNDLASRALQGAEAQHFRAATQKEQEEANGLHYKNKMFISALHSIQSNNDKLPNGPQKMQAQAGANALGQGVAQQVQQNNAQAAEILAQAEQRWRQKNQMMNLVMPEQAKYDAERHIPGVGDASVPVSDQDRTKLSMQQNLLQKTQDLRTWAQQHQGSLNPATVAEGETKARLLQDAYRQANGEGVFRKGESDFISGIIDSEPTKFLNQFRVDPKFKALEGSINADLDTLKGKYGIQSQAMPQQSQQPQAPQMISVVDPQGRTGKIPVANLQKALKQGYKQVQ